MDSNTHTHSKGYDGRYQIVKMSRSFATPILSFTQLCSPNTATFNIWISFMKVIMESTPVAFRILLVAHVC